MTQYHTPPGRQVTEKPKSAPTANRYTPSPRQAPAHTRTPQLPSAPSLPHHLLFREAAAFFPTHLLLGSTSVPLPAAPCPPSAALGKAPCRSRFCHNLPSRAAARGTTQALPRDRDPLALLRVSEHGGLRNLLVSWSQHPVEITKRAAKASENSDQSLTSWDCQTGLMVLPRSKQVKLSASTRRLL